MIRIRTSPKRLHFHRFYLPVAAAALLAACSSTPEYDVVLRGADVAAVLRDSETFSTRAYDTGIMKGALVTLGGESHTRMRRLFNAVLSPRVISRYEEATVTPVARRVVERLVRKERADLFDDFAMSMPMGVTSALFALPHLEAWSVLGTFLVGLALGVVRIVAGSLALCIGVHAGLNLASVVWGLG